MPKVSVNIPCFNSARFIKEAIESVLSQTYTDFEIIVMDDGSVDDTGKIVNSFSDPRIKYFYKENEGLAKTRNKSIALSSGEYIAFLDHDDLWLPEKLKSQIDLFSKDTGLVFSDSYILKNGNKERLTYFDRCKPHRGYIFEDLLLKSSNFIPLPTVIIRKEVFYKIGYFEEDFKIGEEYELFLRVAEHYKFDYVKEPLAYYRIHEDNSSRKKEIFAEEALRILNFWKTKRPELFKKNTDRFLKKEADIFKEMANFYALNSNRKEALFNFSESLKRHKNASTLTKKYIVSSLGCAGYKVINNTFKRLRHGI